MKLENRPYVKNVIIDRDDLICECGQEGTIVHCSNWHNGQGTFYVQCNCGKEFNVHWHEKENSTPQVERNSKSV